MPFSDSAHTHQIQSICATSIGVRFTSFWLVNTCVRILNICATIGRKKAVSQAIKTPKHSHLVICCNTRSNEELSSSLNRCSCYLSCSFYLLDSLFFSIRFVLFCFVPFRMCVRVVWEIVSFFIIALIVLHIHTCSFILPIINCFPHSSVQSSWLMLFPLRFFLVRSVPFLRFSLLTIRFFIFSLFDSRCSHTTYQLA